MKSVPNSTPSPEDFEVLERVDDFKHRAGRTRADNTVRQYVFSLKLFDEWLAENGREPSERALDDFLVHLSKKGLEKSSQSKHYSAVKVYLTEELGEEVNIRSPRVSKKRVVEGENYPSPEDAADMIRSIPEARDRALVSTILDLGIRNGEAVSLDRSDYNPPSITVTREKTRGKPSTTTRKMSRLPRRYLDSYLDTRGDGHPALFVTKGRLGREEPRRITRDGVRYVVGKWTEELLGKRYRPHALRHTRASQLARDGRSIKFIAEFLDITAQTADQIYSHLTERHLDQTAPPSMR